MESPTSSKKIAIKKALSTRESIAEMTPPPEIIELSYHRPSNYVVAKVLHGGMGSVFQLFPVDAFSPIVALKTIRGASSIKSFDIECEAWLSIAYHENVARPLAFGTWKSLPSILIEWYPASLEELDFSRLDGKKIQELINEVVSALEFAYEEKKIVHQDIKPGNILLDKQQNAKLSDFGIARSAARSVKERQELGTPGVPASAVGEISGTPYFMAPELWNGTPASVRTDIFSLGVTFYHCITGEHPYLEGDNAGSAKSKTRKLEEYLFQRGASGREIYEFLQGCLQIDPSQRFQSYEDIRQSGRSLSSPTRGVRGWSVKRSEIVRSSSQLLSAKGDNSAALSMVTSLLKERPLDIILLQECARLLRSLNRSEEADHYLNTAFLHLDNSSGMYEGIFCPEPALFLARTRITSRRYSDAANLIETVVSWAQHSYRNRQTSDEMRVGRYPEMGWYYLYRRDYISAVKELSHYSSNGPMDKYECMWFVEAAWLSGKLPDLAGGVVEKVLKNKPDQLPAVGETEFVFSQLVLRQFVAPHLAKRLWGNCPSYILQELLKLEKKNDVPSGALIEPSSVAYQKPFILEIDKTVTGGVNSDTIRSLS